LIAPSLRSAFANIASMKRAYSLAFHRLRQLIARFFTQPNVLRSRFACAALP
jgi:hypothetical protein